jgi:4,4'-diaponeurosporenoate glycosyltransferase
MPAMLVMPVMAILFAPAIWFLLGRPRFLSSLPPAEKPGKASPAISIIIPARNEETNIARLLESIQQQSLPPLETIVVNDGSTDNTASIASQLGARVIDVEALPDGWMGKPWACQQGAHAANTANSATGDWLLFLDADLILEPSALHALSQVCAGSDQVHSVCPHHVIKHPYEQLSAYFNVLMLAGVNAFGIGKSATDNAALFGQCLLISQKHYQQVNGHETVKDKALENFHLARQFKQLGIPCSCYLGKGLIHMRMFPNGIGELWSSWKKGFTSGAAHTAPRALMLSSLWISGMMLTIVCLILSFTSYISNLFILITALAYLIYACQSLRVFKLAGTFSAWNALFFPLSLLFYQTLFFSALIDKKRGKTTNWKGRAVQ